MQAGEYTLRVAKPLEYRPYRQTVRINGATRLPDIVLQPLVELQPLPNRAQHEGLPPVMQIQAQLSNDELLWNLPGTADDKDRFQRACGSGCHSYIPMFRVRYDERSWALIVDRMARHGNQTLRNRQPESTARGGGTNRGSREDLEKLAKWLATVRGPGAVDASYQTWPRPTGASTLVVVTEYEMPRELLGLHDVSGDSQGNIWFTSHKTSYFGKLDPRTGIVASYTLPPGPGCPPAGSKPPLPVGCSMPGSHRVLVDQRHGDAVWITEPWTQRITKVDPRTGTMRHFAEPEWGFDQNFGIDPDGFLYSGGAGKLGKMNPETGQFVATSNIRPTYDSAVSRDGSYWAGGGPSTGGNYGQFVDLRTGKHILMTTGLRMSSPSRGGWDADGNAWFGGKNGSLVRMDSKTFRMKEFFPPLPYSDFYEALPDRNGEVWAGLLHGRGYLRYNPKTDRWVEYALPEPFGHNRRAWIDESTSPVTIWYSDYQGYIVRIQPME
jgi:streptogramin lyase